MKINFMNLNIFYGHGNEPIEDFRRMREEAIRYNSRIIFGPVSEEEINYIEKQINTTGLDFEIREDYNPKSYDKLKSLNEEELRSMANSGDSHAKYYLSLLLEKQGNVKEAQRLLIDSAINECPLAQYELGNRYYDDNGLYHQERTISAFWTFISAKNGYLEAVRSFAIRLACGNYDVHVGKKLLIDLWLNMADRNDKEAQFILVRDMLMSDDNEEVEKGLALANKYRARNTKVQNLLSNYMRNKK